MSVFICPSQTPGYCVAYVGNIAFEATEADLRAVFEGLAVARVRMHTDAASGRFKGYAHVHFSDEASLDSCAPGPPESTVTAFALDRTEAMGYYAKFAGGGSCLPGGSLPSRNMWDTGGVDNRATWSRRCLGTAGAMQGLLYLRQARACMHALSMFNDTTMLVCNGHAKF